MKELLYAAGGAGLVFWIGCLYDALKRHPDRYRCRISVDPSANKFIWIMIVLFMPLGSMCYLSMIPANRNLRDLSGFHLGAFGTAFIPLVGWVFSMVFFFVGIQQSRRDRLSGTAVGGVGLLLAVALSVSSGYVLRHVGYAAEGDSAKYSDWISTHWLDRVGKALRSYAQVEPVREETIDPVLLRRFTFLRVKSIDLPLSEIGRIPVRKGDFIVHVDRMDTRDNSHLRRAMKIYRKDTYMVGLVRHHAGMGTFSYSEVPVTPETLSRLRAEPDVIPKVLQVSEVNPHGACYHAGIRPGDIFIHSDTMPVYVSPEQFRMDAFANMSAIGIPDIGFGNEDSFRVVIWRDGKPTDSGIFSSGMLLGVDFRHFELSRPSKLR